MHIQTQQEFQVPWGVKLFLGTNVRQWIRDYISEGGGERVVSCELWDGVPVQRAVGVQADRDAVACE